MDESTGELVGAVSRLYRRLRAERTHELGDTATFVLGHLAKEGPRTLGYLSERERVTPPSMNQTVNALVAAGYLVREEDPSDGRKVLFRATPAGIALATENRRLRHAWLNAQLDKLSPAERATVREAAHLLRTLADS
jgi:DNA-binding MarR family transcriptional regulator